MSFLAMQSPHASTIMRRSIQGMLEELEYNLWEHILSRLVDYGHAFSPEIEMAALQGDEALLLHGEAVNVDMALTTQVCFVCWHSSHWHCICMMLSILLRNFSNAHGVAVSFVSFAPCQVQFVMLHRLLHGLLHRYLCP